MDERDEKIIQFLKENKEGKSIIEISKFLNISDITTARILDRLVATNTIKRKEIGTSKLHFVEEISDDKE